jgi:hypothetical protein
MLETPPERYGYCVPPHVAFCDVVFPEQLAEYGVNAGLFLYETYLPQHGLNSLVNERIVCTRIVSML